MSTSPAEFTSVHTQYEWTETAPSVAVISALASLEGVDPLDLPTACDITLYERVNPEALDTLVVEGDEIAVTFTVGEYRVRIEDNELLVDRR